MYNVDDNSDLVEISEIGPIKYGPIWGITNTESSNERPEVQSELQKDIDELISETYPYRDCPETKEIASVRTTGDDRPRVLDGVTGVWSPFTKI